MHYYENRILFHALCVEKSLLFRVVYNIMYMYMYMMLSRKKRRKKTYEWIYIYKICNFLINVPTHPRIIAQDLDDEAVIPAPIRQRAIAAADEPPRVRDRTREVGALEERIQLVCAGSAVDDGAAVDLEARHGDRLERRLVAERQGLVDAAALEREDVFGADAVAAVGDVGEGEVEAAVLAGVCLVELERDEGVRADLGGLRVHLVGPALAHGHDEVRADALGAVGQHDGVLVAGEGGRREHGDRGCGGRRFGWCHRVAAIGREIGGLRCGEWDGGRERRHYQSDGRSDDKRLHCG